MKPKLLILHIARNPQTGVWTMMRNLMSWLKLQPQITIAAGIFADKKWPPVYRHDLKNLEIPYFIENSLTLPGGYLLQYNSRDLRKWINELYEKYKPEQLIVHSHFSLYTGIFFPIDKGLKCPVKVIATVHGSLYNEYKRVNILKKYWHTFLAHRLFRFGATVVSVDQQSILIASNHYKLNPSDFHYIPNGLEDTRRIGCPRLSDPSQPMKVGFLGGFFESKGWHLVAEAVKQVYKETKKVKLIFAGFGGQQYNQAKAWAESHSQFVDFLGYVKDAGNNLMPQLDAYVLPSSMEGMPMVILEALACGVPVIATPVNAIPEMIIDGFNGFLVRRDASDIANRLNLLLDDVDFHQTLSKNARSYFLENFTLDRTAKEYLELYYKITN